MTDTPQHIKDIQLKIWLAKSPAERLRQFLVDNDALYKFWNNALPKPNDKESTIEIKEK